jgi:ribonucleoside-triphosphate reductase
MQVIKRDGTTVPYDSNKITKAIKSAFKVTNEEYNSKDLELFVDTIPASVQIANDGEINVETIQNMVENWLMMNRYYKTAKAYILYRDEHKNIRFIKERIDYIQSYVSSNANAASSSETDDNANVLLKNVANLNGEVYKSINRQIQRRRMKQKLAEMYSNKLSNQYLHDLESHIIYAHDESSFPVVMPYCSAYSLYPLLIEGVGNIDGVTPNAPKKLDSFCGQFVNLVFLLASQVKGAVAFGGLFVAFNYYCVKEWGNDYYKKHNYNVFTSINKTQRTVENQIVQYFQQIIWGINQPAGNRSSQSPFTNVSYYDKNYYTAVFEDFAYPDTTKPTWEQIDYLQRLFMRTLNKERLTSVIAFPVETMCLLSDGKEDILDKDYKEFTAQMYAEGHSFFTYISDSPSSLSSCCRLKSEITENIFSFTNGLSGLKTGSCNVITLNLNRIIQNYFRKNMSNIEDIQELWNNSPDEYKHKMREGLQEYLIEILKRIYKYHTAYKTMLYELEEKGMLNASNAGYIRIKDLYSTIGLNGINEAAIFLGLEVSYNKEYIEFCKLITSTIKKQNKLHTTTKFKFNQEFVPAESLGIKNFNWDKEDGYIVPDDGRVLYNSYFYDAHDDTSIFDKIKLHGKEMTETLDGGVGCHLNLDEHLSKEQYLKIIDYVVKVGCTYFTFNIPNTKCDDCGFITKHNIDKCPKCSSENLTKYTRIIGYLRPTKAFSKGRQIEEKQRTYSNEII